MASGYRAVPAASVPKANLAGVRRASSICARCAAPRAAECRRLSLPPAAPRAPAGDCPKDGDAKGDACHGSQRGGRPQGRRNLQGQSSGGCPDRAEVHDTHMPSAGPPSASPRCEHGRCRRTRSTLGAWRGGLRLAPFVVSALAWPRFIPTLCLDRGQLSSPRVLRTTWAASAALPSAVQTGVALVPEVARSGHLSMAPLPSHSHKRVVQHSGVSSADGPTAQVRCCVCRE